MKITIPKRYQKYLSAMYEVGVLKAKEDLIEMFKHGMQNTIEDLEMGAGAFPPDMDKSLLRGKLIDLEIPYEISEKEEEHVKKIRKSFGNSREIILRAFFLCGLFEYYLVLRHSKRYEEDAQFRKLVDSMPHELLYEVES